MFKYFLNNYFHDKNSIYLSTHIYSYTEEKGYLNYLTFRPLEKFDQHENNRCYVKKIVKCNWTRKDHP